MCNVRSPARHQQESLGPALCVTVLLLLLVVPCILPALRLAGISESAGVALGMFVVHVFTLTAVCVLSALYAFFNVTILKENLQQVRREH